MYYSEFETEPIGNGNPYHRCIHCKISVPEINGALKKHANYCAYRQLKEWEIMNPVGKEVVE